MFEEFSQRKADIDGIEISFVAGGAGPPVLLRTLGEFLGRI